MDRLPSGTVTLLFTDIEGSTRLLGITITANVYAHWTISMAERTAEPMSEILGG
jgi:hypothetical protein